MRYISPGYSQKFIFKAFVLGCVMLLSVISAKAQVRTSDGLTYGGGGNGAPDPDGWGLAIGAGYDGPTGAMRSSYRGGPAFGFSVLKSWNGFTFNATAGYTVYHPKQDTVYLDAEGTQVGTMSYHNFTSLEFFVGGAYNIPVADVANFYLGLNVGAYDNQFKYDVTTADGVTSASSSGTSLFASPKAGLNFILSNHFAFGFEGRYNFQFGSYTTAGDSGYGFDAKNIKTFTVSALLTYYF